MSTQETMKKEALKTFIVSKREVHIAFVYVEAQSAQEAIEKVRLGSDEGYDGLEYSHDLPVEDWTVEEACKQCGGR